MQIIIRAIMEMRTKYDASKDWVEQWYQNVECSIVHKEYHKVMIFSFGGKEQLSSMFEISSENFWKLEHFFR